jgi:hypothetical protein
MPYCPHCHLMHGDEEDGRAHHVELCKHCTPFLARRPDDNQPQPPADYGDPGTVANDEADLKKEP